MLRRRCAAAPGASEPLPGDSEGCAPRAYSRAPRAHSRVGSPARTRDALPSPLPFPHFPPFPSQWPSEFELYYPLGRSAFNYRGTSSMAMVTSAIELIWRAAIHGGAGVPGLGLRAGVGETCVVLVLPDLFDRREGSELLHLLLVTFGFKAAIAQEEAACAAFGADYTSACVVDIGAKRTSVCCVLLYINTRTPQDHTEFKSMHHACFCKD